MPFGRQLSHATTKWRHIKFIDINTTRANIHVRLIHIIRFVSDFTQSQTDGLALFQILISLENNLFRFHQSSLNKL